jgi:integrase
MKLFGFGNASTVGFYANGLYDLGGPLIKKRRQKYRPLTDKSADIRNGMNKNYVIPLWGNLPVSKLTAKKIDDGLINLKSAREGKELSGTIKNTILNILDDVFTLAAEDGKIKYNPVQNIMRFSRELTHARDAIPKNEMDMLFPSSHDDLIRIWGRQIYVTAYLVLRDTGLRPGELRALKWGDWFPDLMFFPGHKSH